VEWGYHRVNLHLVHRATWGDRDCRLVLARRIQVIGRVIPKGVQDLCIRYKPLSGLAKEYGFSHGATAIRGDHSCLLPPGNYRVDIKLRYHPILTLPPLTLYPGPPDGHRDIGLTDVSSFIKLFKFHLSFADSPSGLKKIHIDEGIERFRCYLSQSGEVEFHVPNRIDRVTVSAEGYEPATVSWGQQTVVLKPSR
jgi:hypothetical protein